MAKRPGAHIQMIRQALYGIAFLGTWLACVALGYVIPMMTYDHGDVVSAFMVMIYVPIAAIIGLLPASLLVYAISRSNRAERP